MRKKAAFREEPHLQKVFGTREIFPGELQFSRTTTNTDLGAWGSTGVRPCCGHGAPPGGGVLNFSVRGSERPGTEPMGIGDRNGMMCVCIGRG